jgi:hypothetical protein
MNDDKRSEELERKALALWRQYKFLLPASAKEFFKQLADFLKWESLKKEL